MMLEILMMVLIDAERLAGVIISVLLVLLHLHYQYPQELMNIDVTGISSFSVILDIQQTL
jgi:hypothetical protein